MTTPATTRALQGALERHRGRPGALLPILHDLQDAVGHVPPQALPQIAKALNLSRAEVHGVVTYYHHFRSEPAGARVMQVCRAESCRTMGGEALLEHARARLGCSAEHPTAADGAWTVEPAYCLGLCASSPAAMVGSRLHARLTPERLDALIDAEAAR